MVQSVGCMEGVHFETQSENDAEKDRRQSRYSISETYTGSNADNFVETTERIVLCFSNRKCSTAEEGDAMLDPVCGGQEVEESGGCRCTSGVRSTYDQVSRQTAVSRMLNQGSNRNASTCI